MMPERPTQPIEPPEPSKSSLNAWVARLGEEEMPIFARTANEVGRIMGNAEFSALELARVILQDPSMTAKVLKLANSVFYNPGAAPISTISRAVLVLGFNAVEGICLSIAVIESLLKGKARNRIMGELARSIHAATQARALAKQKHDISAEEVFIVALLYHLGEMAFWCFAGPDGDRLDQGLRVPGAQSGEVERKILGFKLSQLTSELAREWQLSPLLVEALRPDSKDHRVPYVVLGHEIARAGELGWSSSEMKAVNSKVARFLDVSTAEATSFLQIQAEDAVLAAKGLGANSAARLIPVNGSNNVGENTDPPVDYSEHPEPDGSLQLRILREISTSLGQGANLNVLMEMVLEGIYRGVGMDRTVFALLTPRKTGLKAKYVLGDHRESFQESFQFDISTRPPNIFAQLIESREPVWIESHDDAEWSDYLDPAITDILEGAAFVAQAVTVNGNPIGLFYADRGPSARKIDSDAYENFKLFVQQANMGLGMLARRT
jgi:HD-like signal output (HDOD) protein